jgi:hypothetical protein
MSRNPGVSGYGAGTESDLGPKTLYPCPSFAIIPDDYFASGDKTFDLRRVLIDF